MHYQHLDCITACLQFLERWNPRLHHLTARLVADTTSLSNHPRMARPSHTSASESHRGLPHISFECSPTRPGLHVHLFNAALCSFLPHGRPNSPFDATPPYFALFIGLASTSVRFKLILINTWTWTMYIILLFFFHFYYLFKQDDSTTVESIASV